MACITGRHPWKGLQTSKAPVGISSHIPKWQARENSVRSFPRITLHLEVKGRWPWRTEKQATN